MQRMQRNKRNKEPVEELDIERVGRKLQELMHSAIISADNQKSSKLACDDGPSFDPNIHICLTKSANKNGFLQNYGFDHLTRSVHSMMEKGKVICNWVPFNFSDIADVMERHKLSGLIDHILIGDSHYADASEFSNLLSNVSITNDNTFFYHLNSDGPLPQEIQLDSSDDSGTVASMLWTLPCVEFEGIWENLVFDTSIKNELVSYAMSLATLSNKKVNPAIINVNRLILLTGPPGTGKTSLCRGLAQMLTVELSNVYTNAVMFEINSHSLFSKWFSESGKLVQKMFEDIDSLAEQNETLVFVLIDEVESLGMARDSSSSRGDPGDSIRAVNALLTQIDKVRRRSNVLLLCTSNLVNCLDGAFVDRADLVRFVGRPKSNAIVRILDECLTELERVGIVTASEESTSYYSLLHSVAQQAELCEMSGRSIRQIPALALSMAGGKKILSKEEFIQLFKMAIQKKGMDLPPKAQQKRKRAKHVQNGK